MTHSGRGAFALLLLAETSMAATDNFECDYIRFTGLGCVSPMDLQWLDNKTPEVQYKALQHAPIVCYTETGSNWRSETCRGCGVFEDQPARIDYSGEDSLAVVAPLVMNVGVKDVALFIWREGARCAEPEPPFPWGE